MADYTLSQHAKERYSERIMGYDNKTTVVMFINDHEQKIIDDVNKMIEYGELIYTGKPLIETKENNINEVYVKDLWVIITDPNKKVVITLYCIDLRVDDELNEMFVKKLKEKIKKQNNDYDELKNKVELEILETQELIENNEQDIMKYKKMIKSLEEQNENYKNFIIARNSAVTQADNEIRDTIGRLINKKIF